MTARRITLPDGSDDGYEFDNAEQEAAFAAGDPKPAMTAIRAIELAEADDDADVDPQDVVDAWQYLVDTGLAWQLQGWYGRTAQRLIEGGVIRAGNRKVT